MFTVLTDNIIDQNHFGKTLNNKRFINSTLYFCINPLLPDFYTWLLVDGFQTNVEPSILQFLHFSHQISISK